MTDANDNSVKRTLLELLSGELLKDVPIKIDEAIALIENLSLHMYSNKDLDHTDSAMKISAKRFAREFAEELDSTTNTPQVQGYTQELRAAVTNHLDPAEVTLQMIQDTLQQAQTEKDNRDPTVRKGIAAALGKLPAAIDYTLEELHNFTRCIQAAGDAFTDAKTHADIMLQGSLSDEQQADNHRLESHKDSVTNFIRFSSLVVHDFQTQHTRIQKLAKQLEKQFMSPPSAAQETARG